MGRSRKTIRKLQQRKSSMQRKFDANRINDAVHCRKRTQPTKSKAANDTFWSRNKIRRMYVNKCAYCGHIVQHKKMTIDHVIPRSRYGLSDASNYLPACEPCNRIKADMIVEEFREHLQRARKIPNSTGQCIRRLYPPGNIIFHFEVTVPVVKHNKLAKRSICSPPNSYLVALVEADLECRKIAKQYSQVESKKPTEH